MFSPIRPIQSIEVRRVDEVMPRRNVAERVPSPFAETSEGVRITIGANARRLASEQPSDEAPRSTRGKAPSGGAEADTEEALAENTAGNTRGDAPEVVAFGPPSSRELPFKRDASTQSASPSSDRSTAEASVAPPASTTDNEVNSLTNRALRAFSPTGVDANPTTTEEEGERVWSAEESSKVPFEVLQRAVTQATASSEPAETEVASYSPDEPIFSPLENGGEPFGRPVPFELEEDSPHPTEAASEAAGDDTSPKRLTRAEVDKLVADLSWSLPEQSGSNDSRLATV